MFGALKRIIGRDVQVAKSVGHDIANPSVPISPFTGTPDHQLTQSPQSNYDNPFPIDLGLIKPGQTSIPNFTQGGVQYQNPDSSPIQLDRLGGLVNYQPGQYAATPITPNPDLQYLKKLTRGY